MSLLTIIKNVAIRVNYSASITTAFSSTDPAVQAMVACAQDAGDDAVERVDWAALKEVTPLQFVGDGVTAAFPVPNGWQRLSPSVTFISSLFPTLRMPGPVNEDDLIAMKALPVVAQPSVWRQVAVQPATGPALMAIEFFPILQPGEIATYYAAQNTWIGSSLGNPYVPPVWAADTDIVFIPERVVTFGAIWRWKKLNGLDYAEDMTTSEGILDRLGAQEQTGRTIGMSRNFTIDAYTWFPGTITSLLDDGGGDM